MGVTVEFWPFVKMDCSWLPSIMVLPVSLSWLSFSR